MVGALGVVARYAGCWYKAGATVEKECWWFGYKGSNCKSWMPSKKVDRCSRINKKRAARKVEGLGKGVGVGEREDGGDVYQDQGQVQIQMKVGNSHGGWEVQRRSIFFSSSSKQARGRAQSPSLDARYGVEKRNGCVGVV